MAKLKVRLNKEEPKAAPLTYEQINLWSDYAERNPGKTFEDLWVGFARNNPKSGINKEILQKDLYLLREKTQQLASKDGTDLTHIHTGYSFPKVVVDGVDYGRVNANMATRTAPQVKSSYPASLIKKQVPSGVKEVWFDTQKGLAAYENPHTGDIEYAEKSVLNLPQFKKTTEQAAADIAKRTMLKIK